MKEIFLEKRVRNLLIIFLVPLLILTMSFIYLDVPTCNTLVAASYFILMFSFAFIVFILIALAFNFIFIFPKSTRLKSFVSICVLLASSTFTYLSFRFVGQIQDKSMERITINGEVLIRAINSFKEKNGTFPIKLEDLVKDKFTAIPSSGICLDQSFTYRHNGPFTLQVRVGLGFQSLIYRPGEDFESCKQKIGKWAYCLD